MVQSIPELVFITSEGLHFQIEFLEDAATHHEEDSKVGAENECPFRKEKCELRRRSSSSSSISKHVVILSGLFIVGQVNSWVIQHVTITFRYKCCKHGLSVP
jgi:hypothetical protein